MTSIFQALRDDHDLQRRLIGELVETQGDSRDRIELFSRLKAELSAHADYEERHFYVPLMQDDLTQDKARHSVAEHKDLDDLIERLESYEWSAPQWLLTCRELEHQLLHHLEEEEREVFQLAGKVLSEDQKRELAQSYQSDMRGARQDSHRN